MRIKVRLNVIDVREQENEYKTTAQKLPGFCNPYNNNHLENNTNVKKEYSGNYVKFC